MLTYYCVSIRLLNRTFHGRKDRRLPEWPPSPFRMYQALVATASRMGENGLGVCEIRAALIWLEQRTTPSFIIAPQAYCSSPNGKRHGYVLSVPNNAMDIVARAWNRGNIAGTGDTDPATHRTMKTVRPAHLLGGDAIHYLWTVPNHASNEDRVCLDVLAKIANNLTAFGWGIDMAIGHASLLSDQQVKALSGERWVPGREGVEDGLRVPTSGTLNALIDRHDRFLKRVRPNGTFDPTPPLSESAYRKIEYRRSIDPPRRPIAAFSLLKPDASGFRPFDAVRSNLSLAGMMRYAVACAARRAGWPESKIAAFVLGHGESKNENHVPVGSRRFVYLPLPSVESRGEGKARAVGSVRRLMLTTLCDDCESEIAWARRALSGQDVVEENGGRSAALLSLLPGDEQMVRCYVEPAETWATVSPVVLPGYDDPSHFRRRLRRGVAAEEQKRLLERLNDKVDGLLRNAIAQAGFPKELADHAELEWRKVGFWAGTNLADRYGVPNHLKRFPRVHVRLRWRDAQNRPVAIPGPICLGGGRFYGLGLFAAE